MSTNTIQTQSGAVKPEWIRFPKAGHLCPFTGLTRSFLYALATEGKIKTLSLRERGKARGVRLISYDSLMTFISQAGAAA
ncbi:hypothetical protein [Nibricoccus aquaticus]|nr:hypothetical protein [Nibricoccus aquaticus]